MSLFLYKSGTGSERTGVRNIYASLGDTISIDAFVTNYSQVPVSAVELYFTVNSKYFDIVSQGINSDKTSKYYGQPKPFTQGQFFINASGSVPPYGNNTFGDILTPNDNDLEGWQLDYVEITGPDVGFGRPVSRLRYGVVATFKLICKAPCDSATINNDFDTYNLRLTRYFDPTSPNNYSFASFNTCYITVTGVNINPPLPDLYMKPSSADSSLDLDEYVGLSSVPDSLFVWTALGNNKIAVSIDTVTHIATFTTPANFHGYEDVIFHVGNQDDPNMAADTLRVFVDFPPVLNRVAIPDTIFIHEDSLEVALYLPGIVNDADNEFAGLSWNFTTGSNLTWMTTGAVDDTLKLMGTLNFNGMEHLYIRVMDDMGAGDSLMAVPVIISPVNDPPVFSGLVDVTFERTRQYDLKVSDFAYDIDGDLLIVNYNTPQNFTIQVNGMTVTIREKTGFLGSEQIRFIVTDPSGLSASDSMDVTVTPLIDPPVWSKIPKIGFPQNQSSSDLIIWNYVNDPDGEDSQLQFGFSNYDDVDSIYVSPQNGRLYLYDLDNKAGWDMLTVTATDLDGHTASAQFLVFIGPSDGTPIVAAIPDTTMKAGSSLEWIDLDNFYYDVNNSDNEMKWTAAHVNSDSILKVNIGSAFHNVTLLSENINLYGTDTIIFTVSDPGGKSAGDDCRIYVMGKSDPVLDLPNKIGFVTGNKAVIDLDDYVFDPQFPNSSLNWRWTGNTNISINFQDEYLQYVNPLYFTSTDWTGLEKVKFSVENTFAGIDIDSVRVYSVPADGTPVVGGLENVFVRAGYCDSLNIDLDDFFFDADTPDWNMTWSVTGNDSVQVTIDPISHRIIFCSPSLTYEGQEVITITASDGLHQASMDVRVNVYGAVLKGVFSMQLYRNPMQNDYMDIYIKCKEKLKSVPSLRVEVNPGFTTVSMRSVSDSLYYYFGQYVLPYEASLGLQRDAIVIASGTTMAGKTVQDTLAFSYGRLGPGGGKLALGEAAFDIPVNAMGKPSTITLIRNRNENLSAEKNTLLGSELIFKGDTYSLGPVDMSFKVPVKVEFAICCRTDGAGIYKYGKSGWEYIGGSVTDGKISGETVTTGIYALGYDYTPPQISVIEVTGSSQAFRISDYGSGVDESQISVTLNGKKLNYIYNSEIDAYEIIMNGIFDKTDALLDVSAADMSGNFIRRTINGTIEPVPNQFVVEQNVPNPFNPKTTITFSISEQEKVKIEIFDILGRRIRLLTDSHYSSGRHILEWNASDDSGRTVSSGTYLYRVSAGSKIVTKKMLFMR